MFGQVHTLEVMVNGIIPAVKIPLQKDNPYANASVNVEEIDPQSQIIGNPLTHQQIIAD